LTGAWLLPPKLRNLAAITIIFFSATQLGLHLWPSSALVYGVRVDYLAPTLYFLDILIASYLLLVPRQAPQNVLKIAPLLLTNLLFSLNPAASLNWSLHILLYLVFIASIPNRLLPHLSGVVAATITFQTVLAVVQVKLGHAVGGVMYYLGERMVAVGSPAVATATFMDNVVLRAYSTFSHPNVLAGWLVIGLLMCLQTAKSQVMRIMVIITATIGIFLTQSRAALFTLLAIVIPCYTLKKRSHRLLYFAIAIPLTLSLGLFSPSRAELSQTERYSLQAISREITQAYPIFGVGTQSSIASYPSIDPSFRLLQPDHNTATLLLSWFGIAGVAAILALLSGRGKQVVKLLIPLAPLLIFDHYLVTSPQGIFMLLLYLKIGSTLH
jgi:hypothetical protein